MGPGADRLLRSRHLRGPAVHRGDLQRSGWSRAPHSRAVIAAGLVAGSVADRDHRPQPGGCAVIGDQSNPGVPGRPEARAGLWARAVTLAVAGLVAAIRLVGSGPRLPGRPSLGFWRLAQWWPLGSRIERLRIPVRILYDLWPPVPG
jgi:hypothetical protein